MSVFPRASRARLKHSNSAIDTVLPESQMIAQGITQVNASPERASLASMSPQTTELNISFKPPSLVTTTSQIIPTMPKTDYTPRNVHVENQHVPGATGDDTSSSLSDIEDRPANELLEINQAHSNQASGDDDTEAETERLEDSPPKLRKQNKVVLSLARGDARGDAVTMELPSNQNQNQNGTLQVTRYMHGPMTGDLGFDDDRNDPTSDISSLGDSATETSQPASPAMKVGKKRKRSDRDPIESDQDITTESLKKVAAHLASHVNHTAEQAEQAKKHELNMAANDDQSVDEVGASKADSAASTSQLPRIPTSYVGKRRSRIDGTLSEEVLEDGKATWGNAETKNVSRDAKDAVDATSSNGEDFEIGDDAEAEIAARNEEEITKKKTAMEALGAIEKCFATLRDKLFDDRLAQLNEELALLAQPNPTHHEYLAMMECIDHRRDEAMLHEQTLLRYKIGTLERKSVGERAQHHSQYMQTAREVRDKTLEQVSKEWYQIQRERRSWDGDHVDYTNKFATRRSHQITRQMAYNSEVSILSGVAKYVGFPAAPEIRGADTGEIDEDLKSMGIMLHTQPTQQLQPRYVRVNPSTSGIARQRPATEEQFLEQTPWANPQHPVHYQIPVTTHRRVSHDSRPPSPFVTPAAQRRMVDGILPNGSASTIMDLYSVQGSSTAPTPASVEQRPNHAQTGGLILYTPSKPNGVDLQVAAEGIPSNIVLDEGDSLQDSRMGMIPGVSELAIKPSQRPHRIHSPPQRSRPANRQTLETPSSLLPQSFKIPGQHSNAEEVDEAHRHDIPIHNIIPHQIGVMSGPERAK